MNNRDDLSLPCKTCDLEIGDHTVYDWLDHSEAGADLPYEEIPDAPFSVVGDTATGEDDVVAEVFDNITATSIVVHAEGFPKLSGLRFDFGRSEPDGFVPVWSGVLIGPPDAMRKAGKLVRDPAYGAANACEKARRRGRR